MEVKEAKELIEDALKGLKESTQKELKEALDKLKDLASKDEVKSEINAFKVKMADGNEYSFADALALMQKQHDALSAKFKSNGQGSENPESVAELIKSVDLGQVRDKKSPVEIQLKAPATMTVPYITGGSPYLPAAEVRPGVVDVARLNPVIQDYLNVSSSNSPTIVWVNKTNIEGGPAFIAEGTLKPNASFKLTPETSTAKKIAVTFKVSTESLEDIPYLLSQIQQEGLFRLRQKIGTDVLTSTLSATTIAGIDQYAGGYVLTTVKGEDPDNYGALRAARTQINVQFFSADLAFVNPVDAANMELKKGDNGQYVMPPFVTADGTRIAGLRVIETNEIPVGSVLVIDSSRVHLVNYKGPRIEIGWENDDFTKNLRTIIVEQRLHLYVSANEVGALLYDTFANIKTALTIA